MKIWQKTIALVASFALLLNSLAAPLSVLAQETPTPEPTPASTASPSPTDIASPTPSATDQVTPVPTDTAIPTDIEATATPDTTPTATPDATPSDITTPAPTEWTFENVELNKEYTDSQTGVKITFTKLPETSGNIKVEEITLTDDQVKQTGSLSNKAFDITSDMPNGSFTYNLTLPIPESSQGKSVDVKFAENVSSLTSAQNADNTTTTNVSVSVESLDHFTIFIVVDDGDSGYSDNGWNVYTSAGYNGDHRWVTSTQTGMIATWTFTGDSGEYAILPSWVIWSDHATNAHYASTNISGFNIAGIDQKSPANGSVTNTSDGTWSGWYPNTNKYSLASGNTVTLSVEAGTKGNIVADAMAFVSLNDIYVDQSWSSDVLGQDLGGGKIFGINAFSKIQDGINAVSSGGTVNVAAGTYDEHLTINRAISLLGADKTKTIIDGSVAGVGTETVVAITASNVTFKDFTVKNSGTNSDNGDGGIVLSGATGSTVSDNIITNNLYGVLIGIYQGSSTTADPSATFSTGNTISGNTITNNSEDGIYVDKGSNGNTIQNNSISYTGPSEDGDGIYFWMSEGNIITGNTITNNTKDGIEIAGNVNTTTNNNTISSNTIHDNYIGVMIRNGNAGTQFTPVTNNKIYNNTKVNLYADPDTSISIIKNWWGSPDEATIISKLASWVPDNPLLVVFPGTTTNLNYTPWCMNFDCTIFSSAYPTTGVATSVTLADATLNGTNGSYYATGHSIWVSLSPFVTTSPDIPNGVYSTPDFGSIAANANFSAQLSLVTTQGIHSNMPAITPNTKYYFAVWSLVNGIWYPGEVKSFNTLPIPVPTVVFTANSINIPSNGYTNSKTFTFNLTSTDATRYQLEYWNDIPGSSFKETSPWNPTDLSAYSSSLGVYNDNFSQGEGTHYFAFSACDIAGNCSAYSTPFVVTYDNTAPAVQITQPTTTSVSGTVNIWGTVTDANPDHYYLVVLNSSNTVIAGPNVVIDKTSFTNKLLFSWDTTNVADGNYTIDLEARDIAGNKDAGSVTTKTVTVDNTAPETLNLTTTSDGGSGVSDGLGCANHDCSVHPVGAVLGISTTVGSWPKLSYAEGINGESSDVLGASTSTTPSPTPEASNPPVTGQPAKVSLIRWILTHKKIDLGILLILLAISYGIYQIGKKKK